MEFLHTHFHVQQAAEQACEPASTQTPPVLSILSRTDDLESFKL